MFHLNPNFNVNSHVSYKEMSLECKHILCQTVQAFKYLPHLDDQHAAKYVTRLGKRHSDLITINKFDH